MPDTSIIIERPSKLALGDKGFRDIVDAPKKKKKGGRWAGIRSHHGDHRQDPQQKD